MGTIDQAFIPANHAGNLFSTFLQDQITLKPNRVALYAGLKLENNYFTGFDVEPSVRLAWTPSKRRTFWTAISRASRAPTRRDTGLDAVLAALPGPAEVALLGNPKMKAEHVVAYEGGYRAQPADRLSLDFAIFFNNYRDLESIETLPAFFDANSVPPLIANPISLGNNMHGTTEGIEASIKWKVVNRWTLSPGYCFLRMQLHADAANQATREVVQDTQGSNPGHQAQFRSHLEMSRGLAWDLNTYFVNRLPAQFIPSYTRLDTQLTWKLAERVAFSLTGQNLLSDHHSEFNDELQSVNSSWIKRSGFAKITWQF